jgi:molecular chaperone GrpE (heat shock protein)
MSEEKKSEEVISDEAIAEVIDPVTALTDDLQRLQAEFANYRKRVERDRTLASEVAISSVLFEFLAILDDLDRAESHGELSGGFKAIAEQISMRPCFMKHLMKLRKQWSPKSCNQDINIKSES